MSSIPKKKGLGRGLEVLFGPNIKASQSLYEENASTLLPLNQLQPGQYQPRRAIDENALKELSDSIRSQGLIQPILVRPLDGREGDRYEIIAGERRFGAARLAGLDKVPVLIKNVSDQQAAVIALIENIQREDLNPLEEAQGLQRLLDEFDFTHEQAARAVGRSRSAVSNLLRLLNLAQPVQTMLLDGKLDMGHARALLAVDAATQIALAHQIANRRMSVREAEQKVSIALKPPLPLAHQKHQDNGDIKRLEENLSDTLATTVKIKLKRKNQGQLVIDFSTLDALEGIIERLRGTVETPSLQRNL